MSTRTAQLAEIIRARGTLRIETPLHIGGGEPTVADLAVLRDSDGRFVIPGTTWAGVCRHYMFERLTGGMAATEPAEVELLFGSSKPDASDSTASRLIFSHCRSTAGGMTLVRDGVAIDPRTGSAQGRAKYDYELIPPGTAFEPVEIELRLYQEDATAVDNDTLRSYFLDLLAALADGDLRLGRKTSRGFGRFRIEKWRCRAYDLTTRAGLLAWLNDETDGEIALDADGAGLPDKRRYAAFTATFTLRGPLLIAGGDETASSTDDRNVAGAADKAPDHLPLLECGKPVISGTTWAGVLRHTCARIAATICGDAAVGAAVAEVLFGNAKNEGGGRRSRVRIERSLLDNATYRLIRRTAIDRYTGGAAENLLYDAVVVDQAKPFAFELVIERPKPWELTLLLVALRELAGGREPIGSGGGVGRGFLSAGEIEVRYRAGDGTECKTWRHNLSAADVDVPHWISESIDGETLQAVRSTPEEEE